jgi:hypothetical protein
MARPAILILFSLSVCIFSGRAGGLKAEPMQHDSAQQQRFDGLVAKHTDLTLQELSSQTSKRDYIERLSFDPADAKFYAETAERLQLTDLEQQMLRNHGFVSVDHDQQYSFGSLYFAVYSNDLPVLITTDSVLHALHRSYDDILIELEESFFAAALNEVLEKCHDELAGFESSFPAIADNYKDVDLYLTVGRNLLKGAGAPADTNMQPWMDAWDGTLLVGSKLGQNQEALEILKLIQSLKLQNPVQGEFTYIYGGKRAIDYSQFNPRGHYLSGQLARYFRTMMWLGRADTGWNILPPDSQSRIVSDSKRELRNAVVLIQLLQSSGAEARLRQMSEILDFMVGESDNLSVFQMGELLRQQKIAGASDLTSPQRIDKFQDAIRTSDLATQQIRSQAIVSNEDDLYQVPPPSTFQMFGQRFVLDSFVLSKVVFDSIIFDGRKVRRIMPTGLDVMFALGNDSVLPLLKNELTRFPYAANLKASQEFTAQSPQSFWRGNLYNIWLDTMRTLAADPSSEKHFPQAMRTEAWQRKQLQTQLASWAELRHNTVLYAKQSYTGVPGCEYPAGYVEPYPETYARIQFLAEEAARRIGAADFKLATGDHRDMQQRHVEFFKQMAGTLEKLEALSRKELAAQPFTMQDEAWLKKLIDERGHGSGPPVYSGWYSELYYGGGPHCAKWDPTIVDVHTDPESKSVLEQGVGNCNFLIIAIDNEHNRMIYVGPTYSYYEFRQPANNRLTDDAWQEKLSVGTEPPRPAWTDAFQAPKIKRELEKLQP